MSEQELSSLRLLHSIRDHRIDAQSTLVTVSLEDYLRLTEGSEDNLRIQRRVIKGQRFYDRLRRDMKERGTIPAIVLAVTEKARIEHEEDGTPRANDLRRLRSGDVYIVDGLQRTHHLRLLSQELEGDPARAGVLERPLRLEVWTDISFPSILYRMLVLNTAQSPMSVKHQVEIVSLHLTDLIRDKHPAIQIFDDKDKRRRFGPLQYRGSDLVEGFTAFLKRTPLIDAKSIVLEELDQDDFVARFDEKKYTGDIAAFVDLLTVFDAALCERYEVAVPGAEPDDAGQEVRHGVRRGYNFLGNKSYLLGFCAAAGAASSNLEEGEFQGRVSRLIDLVTSSDDPDPLGFARFHQLLPDVLALPRRKGDSQREFVFEAFRKYFLADSTEPEDFEAYWTTALRRL